MIAWFKQKLYFPIAWYFRFFAAIRLRHWHPEIIVITGSSGKTTLLHLVEVQLGNAAKYSHHANSSFGIPFDILELHRKSLRQSEWFGLFFKAPVAVFKKVPKEHLYVVEADCDRPNEGKFLASLLHPDIVLWVSSSRTHSMNFDSLVIPRSAKWRIGRDEKKNVFSNVEEAIAYEYGYFLEYCSGFAAINGDTPLMTQQAKRSKAKIVLIQKRQHLQKYRITGNGTEFIIDTRQYRFPHLLPEELFYSIALTRAVIEHLHSDSTIAFSHFSLPTGRSSVFAGIKNTTIIDSTYNANLSSMKAILAMFAQFPAKKKWVVLSDMMELGNEEQEEHEKLAEILTDMTLERIVLVGKRTGAYTYPKLLSLQEGRRIASSAKRGHNQVVSFLQTKDAKGDRKST